MPKEKQLKEKRHTELQNKALDYMFNKSYWITRMEAPTNVGICDVWGISRACDYATMAIEVKISRSDFNSRSQKYKEWNIIPNPQGNTNYILCPAELIQPNEVKPKWGLLWWDGNRIQNKKQAEFIEMTDRQKLEILIHFLHSGINNPEKGRAKIKK